MTSDSPHDSGAGTPSDDGLSQSDSPAGSRPDRRPVAAVVVAAVVGLLALAGIAVAAYFVLADDEPKEANLADAVAAAGAGQTSAEGSNAEEAPPGTSTTDSTEGKSSGGIAGTWNVDTSIGTFDFQSATGTFAGFRVKEELASVGATEAVGRTGEVSGSLTITDTAVESVDIEVTLAGISSDIERREQAIERALETSEFPTATFKSTQSVDFGVDVESGATVSVNIPGELTIHGVTRQVEFPIEAQLVDQSHRDQRLARHRVRRLRN